MEYEMAPCPHNNKRKSFFLGRFTDATTTTTSPRLTVSKQWSSGQTTWGETEFQIVRQRVELSRGKFERTWKGVLLERAGVVWLIGRKVLCSTWPVIMHFTRKLRVATSRGPIEAGAASLCLPTLGTITTLIPHKSLITWNANRSGVYWMISVYEIFICVYIYIDGETGAMRGIVPDIRWTSE